MSLTANVQEKANMIWNTADILVGTYKPHEYGNVILPMTVLKRFDSVLEPAKEAVLEQNVRLPESPMKDLLLKKLPGWTSTIQANTHSAVCWPIQKTSKPISGTTSTASRRTLDRSSQSSSSTTRSQ